LEQEQLVVNKSSHVIARSWVSPGNVFFRIAANLAANRGSIEDRSTTSCLTV